MSMTKAPQEIQSSIGLPSPKGQNIIAVVSGTRGAGKTWFSITLAHALSMFKQKVLLFDADNGLNNTKSQLGFDFAADLDTVIYGTKSLNQIIFPYEKGRFDIITGNPSSSGLATMSLGRLQILGDDLDIIAQNYDKTIIDISSGWSNAERVLAGLAQEVIVLCAPELKEQTSNYALIRHIAAHTPKTKIRVVMNQADNHEEGERLYRVIEKAAAQYEADISLLGIIRHDTRVRESIRNQVTIITRYPQSEAAMDIAAIAKRIISHG